MRDLCHEYALTDFVSHLAWEAILDSINTGGKDGDYERSDTKHITFDVSHMDSALDVANMSRCSHFMATSMALSPCIPLNHAHFGPNYCLRMSC